MTQEKISILSTIVNLILALLKLGIGFLAKSTALIADGIHSGLDIVSSFITYIGIKAAKKPVDKEHPYGHYRAETIAGFMVTILLLISAIWIIYKGIMGIIHQEASQIGPVALGVVIFSVIINEIMARVKFKVGRQNDNLALVADGQHSRADSISSIAVLIGLVLTRWYTQADGITAILVGLYILHETYILSKEVTDSLLDVANPAIEKRIRFICRQQEIELLELKTRKIGAQNFAELKIGMKKEWRMSKVEQVIKDLQNVLIQEIANLKFVTIQVITHELKRGYIKSRGGQIECFKERAQLIKLAKKGYRIVVPVGNGKIYPSFGAPEYLVVDKDKKGNIVQKKIVKNPYFVIGRGHGARFIRTIEPDKIITQEIGSNARQAAESLGIEIEMLKEDLNINQLKL